MKMEYEISFIDALVIIDPERFKEMDEEFLYAFDIFLDKENTFARYKVVGQLPVCREQKLSVCRDDIKFGFCGGALCV